MAKTLLDRAMEVLKDNNELTAKVLYYYGELYKFQEKADMYELAVQKYKQILKQDFSLFWKNEALSQLGELFKDLLSDKKNAVESFKTIIILSNADENTLRVRYAINQLKSLGVGLEFIKDIKDGKTVEINPEFK